jgi:DNA invertase Pin-like site-specific DNA recombinase
LGNTLGEWQEIGVPLVSLKDQIDLTTPAGRLLVQLLGSFSEFEASLIRERVRAGLANAKAKGRILGRPAKPHRDVEKIAALRGQGRSLRQIAVELGISKGSVQYVLATSGPRNPFGGGADK